MKTPVIITDTSCDIPKKLLKKYSSILKILKMPITLKNDPTFDPYSISLKEFYHRMKDKNFIPITSHVPPKFFMDCYQESLKNNQIPIVIPLSQGISGCYQSALLAKEQLQADEVIVIDAKCASFGTGLLVLEACKMAESGKCAEKIAKVITEKASHIEHVFTVDDLDYLKRGGRISATQAFVGGLLQIKPILTVKDGVLVPIEKVRGHKNIINRMVEIMKEKGKDIENQVIAVGHGDNQKMAEELADAVNREFNPKEIIMTDVGYLIGSHTGPGMLALYFQS